MAFCIAPREPQDQMQRKLRIAIASSGLGHASRGPETWAEKTAHALYESGQSVTLFKGGGAAQAPYERVCPCICAEGSVAYWLHRVLPPQAWRLGLGSCSTIQETSFAVRLLPWLRQRFNVVHTHDAHVALALERARQARLVKAAPILGHGTYEPLEFLEKLSFVQHLAPFYLDEARKKGRARPGWTTIGNFVETDVFAPRANQARRAKYGIRSDSFVVLSVAAIDTKLKRIDHLIEEVALLSQQTHRDVQLLVVGAQTSETPELIRMGRQMLGDRVRFVVDHPHERMPEVYALADVFALCSLWDMMPNALLEAMASGLPCLVSTHPVVGWMAGSGGEAVEMEKEGALAEALQKYMDQDYRRRKGVAARREAVERFSKETIVRQYIAMYRRVIALSNERATP